jgi:hypothetical protein
MPDGAAWKLAAAEARLDFAGLLATVDLSRPQLGLCGLEYRGRRLESTALLGVELPSSKVPPISDVYVRQSDLIVTYTQTPELPFRVQIYWRTAFGPEQQPAIDLQISVQTSLLDSQPQVTTATLLPDAALRHFAIDGADAPGRHGYDLVRPADHEVSYVEMLHPADDPAGSSAIQASADGGIRHRLFASFLEKGVILRARLRGVLLPRQRDAELAAEAYRLFLAAPPPLAT